MPPVPLSDLDLWFADCVMVHEAALTRYLRQAWPLAADVPDLRQDIYERVYESAKEDRPLEPRAFLFTTARNLMADRARRSRIVSIDFTQDLETLDVLVDELSPEQRLNSRQELRRLSEELDMLPEGGRSAIWLLRVEGLSLHDAAQRLGMVESTVASHLRRGLRMLAKAMFGSEEGSEGHAPAGRDKRGSKSELGHG